MGLKLPHVPAQALPRKSVMLQQLNPENETAAKTARRHFAWHFPLDRDALTTVENWAFMSTFGR